MKSRSIRLRQRRTRLLAIERLEQRQLLTADWQNPLNPLDVDGSGEVSPLDALLVINDLSERGGRLLPAVSEGSGPPPYLDVAGNGWVTPLDALLVINALNENSGPMALTANLSPESDPNGNGVVLQPQVTIQGQTQPGASVRATILEQTAQTDSPAEEGEALDVRLVADATGRFQFTVQLPHSVNTLRVEATDRLGPEAVVERVVRHGDVILDWNVSLLNVIRDWTTFSDDPYSNRIVTSEPLMAARNLAMVHLAMYDAVNAIEGTDQPYHVDLVAPEGASPVAAAAAAAHRVASQLYRDPDELAVWDAALAEALATVPDATARALGVAVGQEVGNAILSLRADDGARATVAYQPGSEPGQWNRTFPDFLPPLIPHWFTQKPLVSSQIVTRRFTSFAQAAEEAGLSRMYGGIYFDFDNTAGLEAGRALGNYVVELFAGPGT